MSSQATHALPPIFSIGHSTRPFDAFVTLLGESAVELLVDVRRLPGSLRFPQYHQESLRAALAGHGIDYLHLAALGGRRDASTPDSPNTYWTHTSFRRYADYALTPPFQAGLDELLARSRDHRCALMCAEAVWWRCHRRIISDYLIHAGRDVWHILAPRQLTHATLTPAAESRGDQLIYPGPALTTSPTVEETAMKHALQIGDHVSWASEAGRVRGTIIRVHVHALDWKGYTHHASADEPQYEIHSDRTDHLALHKGSALRKLKSAAPARH